MFALSILIVCLGICPLTWKSVVMSSNSEALEFMESDIGMIDHVRCAPEALVSRSCGVDKRHSNGARDGCEKPGGRRPIVELNLEKCQVRSWRASDAESIAAHADNRRVWINLRDAFPHPYGLSDARAFIEQALAAGPETMFAIDVEEAAVGGIGFTLHGDVERVSAEIGYWLAEPFWGRGIMTEALRAVTAHAIQEHGLTRVFAVPFEWNAASFRVLEKAGYACEARLRRSAIKDGRVIDQLLYAYVV